MKIHYEITDLTGDDHRAGTLWDQWQAQGFTPPLLGGHDYTLRAAVELYGGGMSPWSDAKPISLLQPEIIPDEMTGFWLQNNGASAILSWALAGSSIAPAIDLQLRVNNGDWIDIPNTGGTTGFLLDPRQFHTLTGNAWLGQTVTLTARARLNAVKDWLESDSITSNGESGIPRPVVYWAMGGGGLLLNYALPPNTAASVWLRIDGGPPFEFDPAYPAQQTYLYYLDWRVRLPAPLRDGQEHTLQFHARETTNGVTREYWSRPGIIRVDPLPVVAAPSVHAVEWTSGLTPNSLQVRVNFKPIPGSQTLTVSLQLDSAQPTTKTLTNGQNTAFFPITDDERGYRLARITAQARDRTGGESPTLVHAALLYRGYPQPAPIPAFNAQLLRQGDDITPDRVRFTWTPVPGQLAELFAAYTPGTDYRKTAVYSLGYVDSTENECTLDNTREHFPKTGQLLRIVYGIRPYHLIAGYGLPITADPIQIRAENPVLAAARRQHRPALGRCRCPGRAETDPDRRVSGRDAHPA